MTNADKIMECIKHYKEEAKNAEEVYDRRAESVERMASKDINLFGGTAVSQMADMVAAARKACEGLFTAYQTMIRMIDETCKPLLNDEVPTEVVGDVADFIEWLNDESEIENNYSASFNHSSLGDVASVRFVPTMENKMIQSYWQQKYYERPDRVEASKRREQAEKAEKERLAAKAADEYSVLVKEYEEKFAAWEKENNEVTAKKTAYVEERLKGEGASRLKAMEREHEIEKMKLKEDIHFAEARYEFLSPESSNAGIDKSLKNDLVKNCGETKSRIDSLKNQLAEIETSFDTRKKSIEKELESKRYQFEKDANALFKCVRKPMKPVDPSNKSESDRAKAAIYEWLIDSEPLTVPDIMKEVSAVRNYTDVRVSALVRSLLSEGYVQRTEKNGKAYFWVE